MKRPTRRGLATLVLVGALPILTACGGSPDGTDRPYDPSDGVSTSVGAIAARNLLLVGSAAGQPALVSGVLLNDSAAVITVSLSTGETPAVAVDVPAGGSVLLGASTSDPATTAAGTPGSAVVQFASLAQPAGAVAPLRLSTAGGGTTTVQVPVLPATLEYATLTPSPGAAPAVTPTPAVTPEATETTPATPTPPAS